MQRYETKYDLLMAAHKDASLKKGTISLLQYLVHKSNKEQCFPSVSTIAKALSCCVRTVQYNMRKLEHAGYIIRKDRFYNHQQLSNQYVFNFGIMEEKEPVYADAAKTVERADNTVGKKFQKMNEVKKIYDMPLSAREKLVLSYFVYRSNQKGIFYGTKESIMNAVGIGWTVLRNAVYSLQEKGLLVLERTTSRLVIRLTGAENVKKNMPVTKQDVINKKKQVTKNLQVTAQIEDGSFSIHPEIMDTSIRMHDIHVYLKQKVRGLCDRVQKMTEHIRLHFYHQAGRWRKKIDQNLPERLRKILRL